MPFRPPPTQTPAGNWHPNGRHGSARNRSGRPAPGGGGGTGVGQLRYVAINVARETGGLQITLVWNAPHPPTSDDDIGTLFDDDERKLDNDGAATATAIETLNKIIVTDKRNETVIKAKEMDIASRKELKSADTNTKLLLSREEVFKMLIDSANKSAKFIDAEIIDEKPKLS